MKVNKLGRCHNHGPGRTPGGVSRQSLTLRLDFHLHVIPYFVYIAHFKKFTRGALWLWKNLC